MKFIFTALLLVTNFLYSQTTYYISSKGNDNNSGTSDRAPWRTLKTFAVGNTYLFNQGDTFYFYIPQTYDVAANKTVISSYGRGNKPIISLYTIVKSTSWVSEGPNVWKVDLKNQNNFSGVKTPNSNIGFIKVNGIIYGNKLNSLALQNNWDFYSDENYLYVYSATAPSSYTSFVFSSYGHIVNLSNNLEVSNIKVMGTGSHGVQGAFLKDVTVRNVDIAEIGGSFLPGFDDGSVRFGNGIEFWSTAENCLVENCYIEQVYDVALTIQGVGTESHFVNTIFRNNIVNKNEQSFEAWAREGAIGFTGCKFISNQCYNAGYSWSHNVRPYKSSAVHILTYTWDVINADLTLEGNTFYRAKSGLYFHNPNQSLPAFYSRNNNISLDSYTPIRALFPDITLENSNTFYAGTGQEEGSIFNLVNPGVYSPILETFDAIKNRDGKVTLNWKMVKNSDDTEIEIEKSLGDSLSFTKIGTIITQKELADKIYSFTEDQVNDRVAYYRLKQNDIDDHSTYSKNIVVSLSTRSKRIAVYPVSAAINANAIEESNTARISVYPNPAARSINVTAIAKELGVGRINVYDNSGKRVLTETLKLLKGENRKELNLSSLPKGVYFVELVKQNESFIIKKVVKS